ncbi:MAG: ABC transporter ATP-binding protein/permease [Candidatus Melainabacteria bacterium]|nr:ABC transporter ATP-binding protein/permease [Candidatus Melainabacteria bacterium]
MNQPKRSLLRRVYALCKPYWFAKDRQSVAWPWPLSKVLPPLSIQTRFVGLGLLLLLLAGLGAVNWLNVKLNYAWGDILNYVQEFVAFTAAKNPGAAEAAKQAFYKSIYSIGLVFLYGTFVVVLYRWIRARLALSWRNWMTSDFMRRYLERRNYYRIGNNQEIDNPDERIHQDIDAVVSQTLSIVLVILDSIITLVAFGAVLWSISHSLTWIVIGYSFVGSLLIMLFGQKLVLLNFMQLKLEADYRYALVHVRNNVESIAFYRGEERELATAKGRFGALVSNAYRLIDWGRNVGFLQTAFDYFVTIIPYLIIAPLVFGGMAKIGAFQQAAMAFNIILGALAIFVTEFQKLAQYAANINRLGSFSEALNAPEPGEQPGKPKIKTAIEPRIAAADLTLMTPNYARTLIEKLSIQAPVGSGLLIQGQSGTGKSSLLRAFSGLWDSGSGTIIHPELGMMMFLPQVPYMALGTLRDQLLFPNNQATDDELLTILKTVNLPDLAQRVGGLDAIHMWDQKLSPGERQRIAFARLLLAKPQFAFLDEATSSLDEANEDYLYSLLQANGATYVSVGHRQSLLKYHRHVIELLGDGKWQVRPTPDNITR